jgi:hypothetical protein
MCSLTLSGCGTWSPNRTVLPHRDGMDCECRPTLEEVSSGWLIVHHAWDCREYFEES